MSPVTVTLTVFDECGNPGTCTVEVTVIDDMPPTLVCPRSFDVYLDPDECDRVIFYEEPFALTTVSSRSLLAFLTSTFSSNNQFAGNMFDLTNVSGQPITITSFEGNVNAAAGQTAMFEVFFRTGTYVGFTNTAAGWTSMGTAMATTAGINQPTMVPIGGLTLQPGETYGIYFVMTSYPAPGSLRYTNGNNTYNNGELQISAGVGKGNPNFTGATFNGRTWNGTINYQVVVGAPPIVEQIDDTGLSSGDLFPIGEHCLRYRATDNYGNTSECEFCITVINYPNEITTLQCNNRITLSLDETCMIDLNADMILEGGPYGCPLGYDVIVEDDRGVIQDLDDDPSTGTQLGWEHIGKCYKVTVRDPDNGNRCWGTVCIEDKLPPVITDCPDVTVTCEESTEPGAVPVPTVGDACDPFVSSTYVDWVTDGSCAEGFERIISRRWTFTDDNGNSATCEQTIRVELIGLLDVAVPGNFDDLSNPALECDEKYDASKDVSGHILDAPFCVDGYLLDSALWLATGGDPALGDLSGDRLANDSWMELH